MLWWWGPYVDNLLAAELEGAGSRGPRGRLDTLLLSRRAGRGGLVGRFSDGSRTSGRPSSAEPSLGRPSSL